MVAGSAREVFWAFLKLGLTSFGGPVAHIGYFRDEFVVRRRWLGEAQFADMLALCQFLPGPASSQLGFAIGLLRAGGLKGGIAAWLGFTLPSAVALVAFALWSASFAGDSAAALLHGLKLVAVAVVAHAIWGMSRTLTPDFSRGAIAAFALLVVLYAGGTVGQVGAIVLGSLAGLLFLPGGQAMPETHSVFGVSRQAGIVALAGFAGLFAVPPLLAHLFGSQGLALFDAFYRSGALVFGGGHVVLPLLQAEIVGAGWIGDDAFLAGYGAAQAMPGPLFTFAAYLGAAATVSPNGVPGAAIALAGIFLPGLLLVYGAMPFWDALRRKPAAQAAMRGANAAVVGVLAAAFYDPVWKSAVLTPVDVLLALAGLLTLTLWRLPPWTVVVSLPLAVLAFRSLSVFQGF